jgi:hypothetical protein
MILLMIFPVFFGSSLGCAKREIDIAAKFRVGHRATVTENASTRRLIRFISSGESYG